MHRREYDDGRSCHLRDTGLLAGIAGVLIAPGTFANPYLGGTFNTFGFVSMMIGGTQKSAPLRNGRRRSCLAFSPEGRQHLYQFPGIGLVSVCHPCVGSAREPEGDVQPQGRPLAQLLLLIKQIPLYLQRTRERVASIERPIAAGRADETSARSANPLADRLTRYALIAAIVIAYLVATYFIAGGPAGPRPHSGGGDLRHSRDMPGRNGRRPRPLFAGCRRLLRHRRLLRRSYRRSMA